MVNTEIPKNYTASPSSFSGTPRLTINHEAAFDLDSSNAFEGPEKLLEVWFAASPDVLPVSAGVDGLKAVSEERWIQMLDLVHCRVLSVIRSESVDAYLLSESSMFVFPHKLVLKTCGITTLLLGLPKILEIAAIDAGFPHTPANEVAMKSAAAAPFRVFYSRKNFLHPEQQQGPHRSWRDEVKALDRLFQGGSAYMIGKMNGEHWYLYITEPETQLTPPATPEHEKIDMMKPETETKVLKLPEPVSALTLSGMPADIDQDETLEILMTDLDEENAKQFYLDHASAVAGGQINGKTRVVRSESKNILEPIAEEDIGRINSSDDGDYDVFEQTAYEHGAVSPDELPDELVTEGHGLGSVVAETSGLCRLYPKERYPDAHIDAYLFTPCGFSANGVIPPAKTVDQKESNRQGAHYFTVHVTPEPHCSYASFESNVPAKDCGKGTVETIEQVVNIFRPGRFSVTLFEATDSLTGKPKDTGSRFDVVRGYRRVDKIVHDLDGYLLVFRYYERHDWKGGRPRLGERC